MSVGIREGAGVVSATRPKAFNRPDGFALLMQAETVVVIGASAGEDIQLKLTSRPLKLLQRFGFRGKVYGVNPKYTELDGVPCYPSVVDVPGPVDVAAIFLPKARILPAIHECGKKGVKAVVVFSSGYAETGADGKRDQEELVRIARSYGMRLVGPNASAVVNVERGMVLSFLTAYLTTKVVPGDIALASNSGALLSTCIKLIDEKGGALSLLTSNGNEADLTLSDFVAHAVDDDNTRVIAAFVESIKNGPRLVDALHRAAERGKPVVAVKVGVSERGGQVAASHTGAITGNDRAFSAAFYQLGVTRARDITELVDLAVLFARYRTPHSPEVAIVSVGSGGAAEMMADLADIHGLRLAEFTPEIKKRLPGLLTPFSILVNPIDIAGMTSDLNEEHLLYRRLMENLIKEPSLGIFGLIIPFLPYMHQLAEHVVDLLQTTDKPIVPILTGSASHAECIEVFRAAKVPYFASPDQGIRGLKALQDRALFVARRSMPAPIGVVTNEARAAARRSLEALRDSGRRVVTLAQGAAVLEAYGLSLPAQGLARTVEEAEAIAVRMGFPVALKVESAKIAHKTELGGVRLGLGSAAKVRGAFGELMAIAEKAVGANAVDGILVQRMVGSHTEMILGSSRDPALGHVMLVGLGGIWVELLKDYALRLPPVGVADVREMLAETKAAKMLAGYRGKAPADLEALIDSVTKFSTMVAELQDLVDEIEINPVFVGAAGEGALVGDLLIKLRSPD